MRQTLARIQVTYKCVRSSLTGNGGRNCSNNWDLKIHHHDLPQCATVEDRILDYADVFAQLETTTFAEPTINTGDQTPIRQPARRMPFSLQSQIDQLIQEKLKRGVVVPSASPWSSPVVLVRKDSGIRFCVDYLKLMVPWTCWLAHATPALSIWHPATGRYQWRSQRSSRIPVSMN